MEKIARITQSPLVDYFNSQYPHDTDRVDYAQYLLSMNDKYSIDDFVKIYNDVLAKLLSYLYGDSENYPSSWWDYSTHYILYPSKLKELDLFFNKQVERLFDARKELNDKFILKCIVNLRPVNNRNKIAQRFIASYQEPGKKGIYDAVSSMKEVEKARKHISPYNIDTNEYREYRDLYIEEIKKLIKLGYVKDLKDISFETDTNIKYIASIKPMLLSFLLAIPLVAIFVYLLKDVSLLGLIVIIGLIGAVPKLLLTGKL